MSHSANVHTIRNYLEQMKTLIAAGHYVFVPRRKNMQSLAMYGLTIAAAKNEMLGLVVGDYYKGPKQDFDSNRPGDVWEFKKDVNGICFYIKVKITRENGREILKCLSFHEDEIANS